LQPYKKMSKNRFTLITRRKRRTQGITGSDASSKSALPEVDDIGGAKWQAPGLSLIAFGNHSSGLEEIAHRLMHGGAANSPFGTYVLVDSQWSRVIAERGRAATVPVYVAKTDGVQRISFDAGAVRRTGPNTRALRCYLAGQYLPVGGGLYNGGLRLAPGDTWTWTDGHEIYKPFSRIEREPTDRHAPDPVSALLLGVQDDLKQHSNISVLFSGGIDSSAVAWAASRAGIETHLLYLDFTSLAPLLRPELERARRFAELMELPFHAIPISWDDLLPDYLFDLGRHAPNNYLTASGVARAGERAIGLGSTALTTGAFGDNLWNGSYQDAMYAALRSVMRGDVESVLAWLGMQPALTHYERLRGIIRRARVKTIFEGEEVARTVGKLNSRTIRKISMPRIGATRTFNLVERHLRTELDSVVTEFWQHDLLSDKIEFHDSLRHPVIWSSVYRLPLDQRLVAVSGSIVKKLAWRQALAAYFPTDQHESDRVGYAQLAERYVQRFASHIRGRMGVGLLADTGILDGDVLKAYAEDERFLISNSLTALRLLGAEYWLRNALEIER
jgi:asparagine synthetase B (glutamine-hydrolysing)